MFLCVAQGSYTYLALSVISLSCIHISMQIHSVMLLCCCFVVPVYSCFLQDKLQNPTVHNLLNTKQQTEKFIDKLVDIMKHLVAKARCYIETPHPKNK